MNGTDGTCEAWLDGVRPVLEALPCGAVLLDRDGRVVWVNGVLAAMAGRPPAEFVGRHLTDFYADDPAACDRLAGFLGAADAPGQDEFYVPGAPDGRRRPVIASATALGTEPPLCDHRLVTLIDISRQKMLEEDLREQVKTISSLSDTVLEQALDLKHYSERLEERVRTRTSELHEANLDAIYMLAVASEAKDEDTGRHVRRIESYARVLALAVGVGPREAEEIGYSAILHDVGKIHVPDHILKKPGALTPEERAVVQRHTLYGERILADKPFFALARRIARSHHENWDGSGYPDALAGERIPLEARIVHLADVYDALTSPRVYKAAWTPFDAYAVIIESDGRMFEPGLVRAFRRLWEGGRFDLSSETLPAGAAGSAIQ